ncbi:hypothetical protein AQUCO_02600020v1 [Aquilegia coerulea]|uniref:RING-type E3 ubiquitin transferase n=1 Tax=Aquilegia coerulea TaxID=218851 RepID=A0A2G5D703_AQUCA|nr:hypothetical protein AQUCO_02600020v1 [Aquilegia coerulea]
MSTDNNNNDMGVLDAVIDISLATLALTLGWKFVRNSISYNQTNTYLSKIRGSKKLSISDLRSFASESDINNNTLVVVRGMIKPLSSNSPLILSEHCGREGVLLRTIKTFKLDIFNSLSTVLPSLNRTVGTIQKIPLVLVENDKSNSPSVVINMEGLGSHNVDLTEVCNYVQPTFTKFLGIKFSGVTQVEEEMLLLGKRITAFGNVSVSEDGILEIKACKDFIYFLADITKLDAEMDLFFERLIFMWWKTFHVTFFLGLLVLIVLLRRNRSHSKPWFQRFYSWLRHRKQQGTD